MYQGMKVGGGKVFGDEDEDGSKEKMRKAIIVIVLQSRARKWIGLVALE